MFGNSSTPTADDGAENSDAPLDDQPPYRRSSSLNSTPEQEEKEQKKRRGSGIAKVVQNARNSLHLGSMGPRTREPEEISPENSFAKLSRNDPALTVPQGPNNNSAGESLPTARSTFRVGVAEDKNKKCRRTMEDTHAYLYNFLSTPAPQLDPNEPKRPDASETSLSNPKDIADNVVETDNGYFAIFDGHAGNFAADWCGKKLHLLLEENIKNNPNASIPELFDQTFTLADEQLEKLASLKNSGCTAVAAVLRWEDRIPNSQSATGSTSVAPVAAAAAKEDAEKQKAAVSDPKSPTELASKSSESKQGHPSAEAVQKQAIRQRVLYTANVGDARIVLCRNGKALRLSYDHKGSDEYESKRISNAGGLILNNRVNGVLAVTRALGDAYMKTLVTGHPYTTETVIQPELDEFVILACDGLWDVCTDQEAVDLVRKIQDPQMASQKLVDHALSRFSTDNLSCMTVRLDSKAIKETVEKKKPLIGVEGDVPSNSNGLTEAEAIVLEAKIKATGTESQTGTVPTKKAEVEPAKAEVTG